MSARPAALAFLAVLLTASALAQNSPDEQARRLLEDGRAYRAQGKLKQALDNFNTIVTGFPNTDSVDDALLEIGRHYLEVEVDAAKARDAFDQVARRFPQSDGAPGAYYYLGWMTMTRATAAGELEDALAQFTRVQRLYPRSEWVPRALHATALAQRKAGRLADAVEAARRVALEYPSSDAAPAAQFQVGHCLALMGEPRAAMEEYQQVRNRFPESEWAASALDRITALYRLYGFTRPIFSLDASFSVGGGDVLKDVRAIFMTPARVLWIASDKKRSVVSVAPDGKLGGSTAGEDLRSLSLSPHGDLIVTAKLAVRLGRDIRSFAVPDAKQVMEPLDHLDSAVALPGGGYLVADGKRKRVFRYDVQFAYKGPFPDNREREVTRMLLDGESGIVLLDRAERAVKVVDETGRLLRSLGPRGPGFELRKPVDVAVDVSGNAYVAEEDGPVYVISPQGQLLVTIASPEMKKPGAVTLDPSGAVLVYDERLQRVLRFK